MDEILGVYRGGRIELGAAVDWPEGTRVIVQPQGADEEPAGTELPCVELPCGTLQAWSDTPEFRAALLAQMDRREPVELTAAEEAEWHAARKWIREFTTAAVRREMGLDP